MSSISLSESERKQNPEKVKLIMSKHCLSLYKSCSCLDLNEMFKNRSNTPPPKKKEKKKKKKKKKRKYLIIPIFFSTGKYSNIKWKKTITPTGKYPYIKSGK